MTTGAMFWLLLGGVAMAVFFGIALVVSIRGVGDLRDLLRSTGRKARDESVADRELP
jgi:hypothetical protein